MGRNTTATGYATPISFSPSKHRVCQAAATGATVQFDGRNSPTRMQSIRSGLSFRKQGHNAMYTEGYGTSGGCAGCMYRPVAKYTVGQKTESLYFRNNLVKSFYIESLGGSVA